MQTPVLVLASTLHLTEAAIKAGLNAVTYPEGLRHHTFNSKQAYIFLADTHEPGWMTQLATFASRPRIPFKCIVVGDDDDVRTARRFLQEEVVWSYLNQHELEAQLATEVRRAGEAALRTFTENTEKERLFRQAYTDSLTGLKNRSAWDEAIRELARSTPAPPQAAVALFDLVDFKKINDSLGQDVGDVALQTFAKVLRKLARRTDDTYRHGGDEFAIIFRNLPADSAALEKSLAAIATKLTTALETIEVPLKEGEASFGSRFVLEAIPARPWKPEELYRTLAAALSHKKAAEKRDR